MPGSERRTKSVFYSEYPCTKSVFDSEYPSSDYISHAIPPGLFNTKEKVRLILPVTKDRLSPLLETQNDINFGRVKALLYVLDNNAIRFGTYM